MPVELNKYEDLGELEYAQVDQNWKDIEDAFTTNGDDIRQQTSDEKAITPASLPLALQWVPLSFNASMVIDGSLFYNGEIVATANMEFVQPVNFSVGTKYIMVKGDGPTNRAITFDDDYFKGDLPAVLVNNTSWALITVVAYSASHYIVVSVRGL